MARKRKADEAKVSDKALSELKGGRADAFRAGVEGRPPPEDDNDDAPDDIAPRRRGRPPGSGGGAGPGRKPKRKTHVALPGFMVDQAIEYPLKGAAAATAFITKGRVYKDGPRKGELRGPLVIGDKYDAKMKKYTQDTVRDAIGLIEVPIGWAIIIGFVSTYLSGLFAASIIENMKDALSDPAQKEAAQEMIKALFSGMGMPIPGAPAGEKANGVATDRDAGATIQPGSGEAHPA